MEKQLITKSLIFQGKNPESRINDIFRNGVKQWACLCR